MIEWIDNCYNKEMNDKNVNLIVKSLGIES